MNLLEKWIWEKYRKNIEYTQLIDASEIDTDNSSTTTHLFRRNGDLLVPLRHNKDFWGQMIVKAGSDLSTVAIEQIIDLTDLYFKLRVSRWTADLRSPFLEEKTNFLETEPQSASQFAGTSRIFFLKSANKGRANYIVDFLQDKMSLQGKLPWSREQDIEDATLTNLLVQIEDINAITTDDLLNWALSERKPHLVITSKVTLSEWHIWTQLAEPTKSKLNVLEADLDSMPVTLVGARECIDLLWFAH